MPEPVCIIATQRSGTNYFRSLLRCTGTFADYDEIFHSEVKESNRSEKSYFDWSTHSYFNFRAAKIESNKGLSIPLEKNVNILFNDYFDHLSSLEPEKPFYLIDIKYNSLHHFDPVWQSLTAPKYFFQLLKKRNCHVIHLVRENFFRVYLSEELTRVSRTFVKTMNDNISQPKLELNPSDVIWNIKRIEREVDLVRHNLGQLSNVLEITYESLLSNNNKMPGWLAKKLNDFFSLQLDFERRSEYKQIINDPWLVIKNVKKVKQTLRRSGYARFIQ